MNDAHLHLLVNHFPIIGTILGVGILIAGLILKNNTVKNTAYSLFIVAAIFTIASMSTGEGAEDLAENLPGVTEQLIHEHEEMAEKFALVLYVLGFLSLVGLYLNITNKAKGKLVAFVVLTVSIVGVVLAKETGTTGGEIRHTEIRANAAAAADPVNGAGEEQEEE